MDRIPLTSVKNTASQDDSSPDEYIQNVQEFEFRLKSVYKSFVKNQGLALIEIKALLEECKSGLLYPIENQIDNLLLEEIHKYFKQKDDSLTTITAKIFLGQIFRVFQVDKARLKPKALEYLSSGPFEFNMDLLIFFFEPSDEWLKALKAQQFTYIPKVIVHLLEQSYSFSFLIESLISTIGVTFCAKAISGIMFNLRSNYEDEQELLVNVKWVVELIYKDHNYAVAFLKEGLLEALNYLFNKKLSHNIKYLRLITHLVLHLVRKICQPDLLVDIYKSRFICIYSLGVADDLFDAPLYNELNELIVLINENYHQQLINCLPESENYQQILIKLVRQTKNIQIANYAKAQMMMWLQSDHKRYFEEFQEDKI